MIIIFLVQQQHQPIAKKKFWAQLWAEKGCQSERVMRKRERKTAKKEKAMTDCANKPAKTKSEQVCT